MNPCKYLQTLVLMISITLLLVACNNTTKVKTGALKGIVSLINDTDDPSLDPIDFTGITVSVYELAEYDYNLKSFLIKYPNVGFALSQNSEFDHYEGVVVAQTKSNVDGSFELKKIPVGKYNIVLEKAGWGYRYVYDKLISEGDNKLTTAEDKVELYPERHISGTITDNIIIENWHHLVIEDDANFLPQSSLIIKDNGVLRLNSYTQVNVYGEVCLQGNIDNSFQIKLNRLNNSDEQNQVAFAHLNLMPGSNVIDDLIKYGRFSGGIRGIGFSSVESAIIKNCRFLVKSEGVYFSQGNSLTIENCVFTGEKNSDGEALSIYDIKEGKINHNCFMFLSKGIEVLASNDILISHNGFCNVNYAIESFDTESNIQHNNFDENKIPIRVAGNSSPTISYNQINAEQGIFIGKNDYYSRCKPVINQNNLQCSRFFMTIVRPNRDDIDAKNNYFYTTDVQEIRNKIKHKPDYPTDQQIHIGNIIFEPFMQSKVKTAGIM